MLLTLVNEPYARVVIAYDLANPAVYEKFFNNDSVRKLRYIRSVIS